MESPGFIFVKAERFPSKNSYQHNLDCTRGFNQIFLSVWSSSAYFKGLIPPFVFFFTYTCMHVTNREMLLYFSHVYYKNDTGSLPYQITSIFQLGNC